jgi:histidinol-phosphate aminotransferase
VERKFWSKEILNLVPYTPGEQPKINDLIKLNTNENPYSPSPKVAHVLESFNTDHLRRYPDPESTELCQALASYYQVNSKNIFIGNGSDEVLAHAFMAFFRQDKPILMPDISYSFYTVYCDLYKIEATSIAIEDDFSINLANYHQDNGGIIFANPNAPTGKEVPLADIEELLIRNTQSLVIVDEAYVDFGGQSAIELTNKYDNCLVIQTFSKARSLAGLRIGFAIGHESLISALERVKNSFNSYPLDMLAQKAAIATIEDNQYFDECVEKIVATRQWTDEQLKTLGFNVIESKTNFIFASHPSIDALAIMQYLRDNKIIVRHFTKEKISNYLRITIGTQEDMQSLIKSLQQLIK